MLEDEMVFAFIPARGGSKGLPGKNLMKLAGKTLIERAVESASDWLGGSKVDVTIVSSDDEDILANAKAAGAVTFSVRLLPPPMKPPRPMSFAIISVRQT